MTVQRVLKTICYIPRAEDLGSDVQVIHSECDRNIPLRLPSWSERKCVSDDVLCKYYMIKYGDHDRNVEMCIIISLLDNKEAEYYTNIPSKFHIK